MSKDPSSEPRFQVSATSLSSAQVFGIDVEALKAGDERTFDAGVLGYPLESLRELPPGEYTVQALLHKYETFRLATGHTVKLPMDRGEGQQWQSAPGNIYSAAQKVRWDGGSSIRIELDKVIPPLTEPADTKYVKHVRIKSDLLSKFWGRDMFLGAHVLLPEGFDTHPNARYPLIINHGHFPSDLGNWRDTPPDPNVKCEYSERFHLECYNRIQQQAAYDFYKEWTGPNFPRVLVIEIQHANPYYDDSYTVNSANLGPYGDAIMKELVPAIESRFRGIGAGWARATYGGSTGGWEALHHPDVLPRRLQRRLRRVPRPHRLPRLYRRRHLQGRQRLLGRWSVHESAAAGPPQLSRPPAGDARTDEPHGAGARNQDARRSTVGYLGSGVLAAGARRISSTRIWDKRTGVIDKKIAEYWKEHYDLSWILRRDWNRGLGRELKGKIHLYVGDMDNYYLNNAVYLVEDFLKATKDPAYGGEVTYGDRAEHCWNGDPTRANASGGYAAARCSFRASSNEHAGRRLPAPTCSRGATEPLPGYFFVVPVTMTSHWILLVGSSAILVAVSFIPGLSSIAESFSPSTSNMKPFGTWSCFSPGSEGSRSRSWARTRRRCLR